VARHLLRIISMPVRLDTHVILPAQYFGRLHVDKSQPEKRLMAAVLEDAIAISRRCGGRQTGRGRRLFTEVQTWLEARNDRSPFAFVTICDVLGLDAGLVRAAMRREQALLRDATVDDRPARDLPGARVARPR
jgi:hypothetical protein